MEIPRSGRQLAQQRRQVREPAGEHVDDLPLALDLAVHGQQLCAEQLAPLPVAEIAPDDHVDRPRFILQRDEDDAARGVRPLAADDDAGGAHDAAMRRRADVGRGAEPPSPEPVAQQRHRVPAQREAERPVVGDDVLALGRRR